MRSDIITLAPGFNDSLKKRYGKFPIKVDLRFDLATLKYAIYCRVLDEKQFIHNFRWVDEHTVAACRGQVLELFGLRIRDMVLQTILGYCRAVDGKK